MTASITGRMTNRQFSDWLKTLTKAKRLHAKRLYDAAANPADALQGQVVSVPPRGVGQQAVTDAQLFVIYRLVTETTEE